jgi:hypothetical protein
MWGNKSQGDIPQHQGGINHQENTTIPPVFDGEPADASFKFGAVFHVWA